MRIFVAAEIPEEIRAGLAGIRTGLTDFGLRQLRWVEPSRIHLTLRFCGEMSSEAVQRLATALGAPPPLPAFRVTLEKLHFFPARGSPRLLVISLDRSEPLEQLARWIDQIAVSVGVEKEDRPYRPHLTLARFRSDARARHLRGADLPGGLADMDFAIDRFQMMESRLGAGGPTYTVLHEYGLRGGPLS